MTKKIRTFILIIMFIQYQYSQSQDKIEYYKYGQNGIELIFKNNLGTIIVSTFNAKLDIKSEVAKKVYEMYLKKPDRKDSLIKVKIKTAKVFGKLKVIKKNKTTSLNFYYNRIEWKNGLVEEHIE